MNTFGRQAQAAAVAAAFLAGVVAGCTGLAALGGHAQSAEVAAALDTAAARYGIRPAFLRCLAWQESRYQPGAVSPGGRYRGLLQFDAATFALGSRAAGLPGASVFDPWAASEAAAVLIWHGQVGRWPPAARCGRVFVWA